MELLVIFILLVSPALLVTLRKCTELTFMSPVY